MVFGIYIFFSISDGDYKFDSHSDDIDEDEFDDDDVLDRLQEVADLNLSHNLIYPHHDDVATIKRSDGSTEADETFEENSLEELAWDQFIRTKVGQHDMNDLDDLDLGDVMMGDSPSMLDPPNDLDDMGMRSEDEEIDADDIKSIIKRKKPKGSRKKPDGQRRKVSVCSPVMPQNYLKILRK